MIPPFLVFLQSRPRPTPPLVIPALPRVSTRSPSPSICSNQPRRAVNFVQLAVIPDVDPAHLEKMVREAKAQGVEPVNVAQHIINQLFEAKSYPKAPVVNAAKPVTRTRTVEV